MDKLINILQGFNAILLIVLAFFMVLAFIFISQTNRKINRLNRRYNKLLRGRGEMDMESLIADHSLGIDSNVEEIEKLKVLLSQQEEDFSARLAQMDQRTTRSLQRVGFHSFNAFEYSVGNLSFSLCLLDHDSDGFILTSIYGEKGSNIYGKEVKRGKAVGDLSIEEEIALGRALN